MMDQTTLLLSKARYMSAIARLCLGPLLPLLTLELELPESSKPALLSAYSSGYILTQIGGGYLADRYGYRKIIALITGISAFILFYICGTATTATVWTQAYFFLGVVAGPLFPAGSTAIYSNVPSKQRAASASIVDAAASAGATVASLTPLIATEFLGWKLFFRMVAAGLAVVAVTVETSFPSEESSQKNNSCNKKDIASTDKHKGGAITNADTISALLHPIHILTYVCHSAENFSKYSINSWTATMLVSQHEASPVLVGTILGMQEGIGVLSKLLVGILLGGSSLSRGTASAIGFAVQGIGLWMAFAATTVEGAGAFLWISAMAVGSHSIGFRPIYVEGSHAGAVSGFGNTIASFASVLGPLAIGTAVRVDGGKDWLMVALWMLMVNLLGSVAAMGISLMENLEAGPLAESKRKD